MDRGGRRPDARKAARAATASLAASCLLPFLAVADAAAREVAITGTPVDRYGRIVLRFDQQTKVAVRAANGVVAVSFAAPARVTRERLALELPRFVAAVRRDPDETGLRLALVAGATPHVTEAGERVFIDLLPAGWTGLPPGLPQEVVTELADRARDAEAKLRADAGRAPAPAAVPLRMAETASVTRLVLEPPPGTPVRVTERDGVVEAMLDGRLRLEPGGARPKLAAGIADFTTSETPAGITVRVTAAAPYAARHFRDGDAVVIDVAQPGGKTAAVVPDAPAGPAAPPPADPPAPAPPPPQVGTPVAAAAVQPNTAVRPVAATPRPAAAMDVAARFEDGPAGTSILFPFAYPTPAAAFERAGQLVLIFDTPDRLDIAAAAAASGGALRAGDLLSEASLQTLRLTAPPGGARLVPDGTGWRLAFGPAALPPDAVRVGRAADGHGRPKVAIGLAEAATVRWIADVGTGGRLAVIPARGRPQAMPMPRSFVEFALPPTLQGVVVEPFAEDVTVSVGEGGVQVSRGAGLAISPPGGGGETATGRSLVVTRGEWADDLAGDPNRRLNEIMTEVAEASPVPRSALRIRLARFLLAHGLNHEATGVLAVARADDLVLARRRDTLLLSGIAEARTGHLRQARGFLAADVLVEDAEAVLWRAVVDAKDRRWPAALAGFMRSGEVLGMYPEELTAPLRLLAARTALEAGVPGVAEGELGAIDNLPVDSVPRDVLELVRARHDAAAGRGEAALRNFDRLAREGSRPVAAEAELRAVALGRKLGRVKPDEAVHRLEMLSVTWRGDEIELGATVDLARLYADAGRWRDTFTTVRRANTLFPNHELTRGLYDDTVRAFEGLILGEGSGQLSAVETLALYYDFKEFAPVGRRGDEIVRRLADRLVELDLLDQAGDLLQHQVDKRLSGAARAAVAARLAAIRLLAGKPALALAALHGTRRSELPGDIRRIRLLLEAHAQADLSRLDLALEIVDGEEGADFARLKAGILFGAGRWREAGETGEAVLGRRWQEPGALADRDRADALRSAVAYALAGERLALDRLRQKFGPKMADSPDARTFELLMRPGAAATREFREAATAATRGDALRELLADWKARAAERDDDGVTAAAERARAG